HGFSAAFPGVILRVTEVPATAYSGLRERKHDLILEWYVPPYSSEILGTDVKVEFLFDDHLVIVAGPQSHWARRRKIDLADLAGERWILGPRETANYVDTMEAFRARGLAAPTVAVESLSVPLRSYL